MGKEEKIEMEGEITLAPPSVPPESTPSSFDGAKRVERSGGLPRDLLERELRDKSSRGVCLICGERATHAMPRRVLVKPFFDFLFRYYGIVVKDHYKIEVHHDSSHGSLLCVAHHQILRSKLECKVAAMSERYAQFVDRSRTEMLEFERYEIFEDSIEHEQMIRGRKQPKRRGVKIAPVVSIGDKKASGS